MTIPSVSVIIPVYMVENYIARCAESLFCSTLHDIEFLFVDDCTRDKSIQILKEVLSNYPERKEQVRVIKMPQNSGQAAVREKGILEASGEYIIHCDSDDWVDPDLYCQMYRKAKMTDADVVFCDEIHEYAKSSIRFCFGNLSRTGRELMKDWYRNIFGLYLHNKLVRRTIFINHGILPWPDLNMWEDNGLIARALYYSNRISYIRGPVYHYNRANVAAVTSGYGKREAYQMIGIAEQLSSFFESVPDAQNFYKTKLAFQFLAKINLITDSFKGLRDYYHYFPEADRIIKELDTNAFSKKGRIRFFFVKHHMPFLFILLMKLYIYIRTILKA